MSAPPPPSADIVREILEQQASEATGGDTEAKWKDLQSAETGVFLALFF